MFPTDVLTKVWVFLYNHRYLLRKLFKSLILFMLLSFFLHPSRFAVRYSYIESTYISNELEPSPNAIKLAAEQNQPLCPLLPTELDDTLMYPNESSEMDAAAMITNLGVKEGGTWEPIECISQHQVAIIIPYRNRSAQLNTFLAYMHSFLQKQMLKYIIVVVEQSDKKAFNRAKLFNIGYKEALKTFPYHCFIFHDIDLIPQKLGNIYACTHQPRHMSSSVNIFRYNLPYSGLFGGVVAIQKSQFELVNGFSNEFFGWGGEDDNFLERVERKDMSICRFAPEVARYVMLKHTKAEPSKNRYSVLSSGRGHFDTDGLTNLQYTVIAQVDEPLYKWVLVDL